MRWIVCVQAIRGGGDAPDDFAEIPAETWLDRRDADKVVRVLEHSISMPNYDAVLDIVAVPVERRWRPRRSTKRGGSQS
jgi:hypothetical protein